MTSKEKSTCDTVSDVGAGAPADPSCGGRTAVMNRTEASREALRDFLYQFIGYVKARKLYPPGHSRLASQLEIVLQGLEGLFESLPELTLFVKPHALFVNGEEFSEEDTVASDFAGKLLKRLMRYVVIQKGVTGEELEALADPLLQEPAALQEEGGVLSHLESRGVRRLLVIEWSYDQDSYIDDEEDLRMVRTLAGCDGGTAHEPYILRRLQEMAVKPEERRQLGLLLSRTEIVEKLDELSGVFGRLPSGPEVEMHTSDLMLSLVRSIVEAAGRPEELDQVDASKMVFHILEQVEERLLNLLSDRDNPENRKVLDQVASHTASSAQALFEWLSIDASQMSITLSSDQAGLIKAIFARSQGEHREIRFGDARLEKLKAPEAEEKSGKDSKGKGAKRKGVQPKHTASRLVRQLAELADRNGSSGFVMDPEAAHGVYPDILLEMLRVEDQALGRERILREVGAFLARSLDRGKGKGDLSIYEWYAEKKQILTEEDMVLVLLNPEVARKALQEYLEGCKSWQSVLNRAAGGQESAFAHALGGLLLNRRPAVPLRELEGLLLLCQEKIVGWLQNRLDDEGDSPPLDRLVSITLACRTPRMVPLLKRLLVLVDGETRWSLLRKLDEIDDPRAVRLLCHHLEFADGEMREEILRMLGNKDDRLAEETLLAAATRPHWPKGEYEERLAALSALCQAGTVRSQDELERLSNKRLYLLTRKGRKIRALAAEAVKAIKFRRLKSRPLS